METKKPQNKRIFVLIPLGIIAIILISYQMISSLNEKRQAENNVLPTAIAYLQQGNYDQALALFNQQISSGVDLVDAYGERGNYYVSTNHLDEAIADFTASLKLSKTVTVLTNRCNAYRLIAKYDLANADCNEAKQMDPKYIDAYIVTGSMYMDQNQLDKARNEIKKALEIDPKSAKASYVLAQIDINSHLLNDAVKDLNLCLQVDPENPEYYWQRGFLYLSLGKVDEAKSDMRAVLKYGTPERDGELLLRAGSELRILGEKP